MAKILYRKSLSQKIALNTGAAHTLQLGPSSVPRAALEDAHFHFDSAVLLPDQRQSTVDDPRDVDGGALDDGREGLAVIAAALRYAEQNPNRPWLVVGHTDRSGPDAYNIELSELRAKCAWAVFKGSRDDFVDVVLNKHKVQCYQHILKWVYELWAWPCDPGPIDDVHGSQTTRAIENFQTYASQELQEDIPKTGRMDRKTWGGVFAVYQRVLRDVLELEQPELEASQSALSFLAQGDGHIGCGEAWPIVDPNVDGVRSGTNRRVEILSFDPDPADHPRFDCHPAPTTRTRELCELHNDLAYPKTPIPVPPIVLTPVTLALAIADIRGLYRPETVAFAHGSAASDDPSQPGPGGVPTDATAPTNPAEPRVVRGARYEPGYKSDDDRGRIYVNHVPYDPDAGSMTWQDLRKKNKQYVELTAEVTSNGDYTPGGLRVDWFWEDPDDPSNDAMRDDASRRIDPNDATGSPEDDNRGTRDFPSDDAGAGAKFEEMPGYGILDGDTPNSCHTPVVDGVSKVRMHVTNVGGDNFLVRARLRDHPLSATGTQDATGVMTIWKRVDLEYRRMPNALLLPVNDLQQNYDRSFVQWDITGPLPAPLGPDGDFMAPVEANLHDAASAYVENPAVFSHLRQPGWFLVVAALRAVREGTDRFLAPEEQEVANAEVRTAGVGANRVEVLRVHRTESFEINRVALIEGSHEWITRRGDTVAVDPATGDTIISIVPSDYASDFEPGDGSLDNAYRNWDVYWPRHRSSSSAGAWTTPGYGFAQTLPIRMMSRPREWSGVSPSALHGGTDYFAGRTIIYTRSTNITADNPLIMVLNHELCHAFGFPHKCGYYTWEDPAARGCAMNYENTWVYAAGSYDPATRVLERFQTPTRPGQFCARHVDGVRRVHLEDNPAIWTWT